MLYVTLLIAALDSENSLTHERLWFELVVSLFAKRADCAQLSSGFNYIIPVLSLESLKYM